MTGVFSPDERRELAGRARTLHERLDGPPNEPGGDPPFDPDEVLAAWRERFPDESAFRDRLAHDGLAEAEIREQAAATRWPADVPLPDWVDGIEAVIRHVETADPAVAVGGRADDRPAIDGDVPFAPLLARIAGYGYARLPGDVPREAAGPTVAWLGRRLRSVATRPLYVEFKSFVAHHDPELARADPDGFEDPPTDYYEAFVDAMVDGGFRNLCPEYPVLARRFVRLLTQWVDAVAELCRRIDDDRAALESRFGVAGAVASLEPLADDAHARGRVPVRVHFESGSVVYKPRPVDAGIALYEILDRLDDHLPWSPVRAPRYCSREGYGWMEPVEYRDPTDEAAVERYYERAGAIACVAYALGLTDCQFENLLVDGERPTILDAETLFHPPVVPSARTLPTAVAAAMGGTVLFTAMFPRSIGDPVDLDGERNPAPIAAFADETGEVELSGYSRPAVEAVNTDVMAVEGRAVTVDRTTNVPTVGGEERPPGEHVEAIVRGFERTYDAIGDLHADGRFRSEIADRSLVEGIENRLVYRGTQRYAQVLRSSAARDPLRDGARLTVEFERLAVPFFGGRIESDRYWPLYEAERRSLRRLDVPRFTSSPTGTALRHDGTPLDLDVDESGYERSRRRLDSMDGTDRRRQTWLIRRCFQLLDAPDAGAEPIDPGDDRLVEEAAELGDAVVDAAFETAVGDRWASFSAADGISSLTVLPADVSLYNGRGGIGLAFAAMAAATGDGRFRRRAVETLDAVVDEVVDGPTPLVLGGTAGLGSVVYVLSVAGELLDVARYPEVAADLAGRITADRLAADDAFDVMTGSAGSLLALLAHHDRYGGSAVLDRALAAGERLLDARESVDGYRVWRTVDGEATLGFAHGSSGIAYALARLATTVEDERFEAAAREALAFESSHYSVERTNWLDPGEGTAVDRWCHGRTGIALARAGIGTLLDDEALLAGATDAMAATAADGLGSIDTVCCGNVGRAEAMLEVARRTGAAPDDAREFLGRCLARKEREGPLAIPGHSDLVTDPTFFDGVSGVAYAMLRLRTPDDLPCALLLE